MNFSTSTKTRILLGIIYLGFISLGLPDGALGIGWPLMRVDFGVPIHYAGFILFITLPLSAVSSLMSAHLGEKYGVGKLAFASALLTSSSLLGISTVQSYLGLILFSIGLGIGQGAVDALLNAYVAKHYNARHMSWLHGCWAVGATIGPALMTRVISTSGAWSMGYLSLGSAQLVIAIILLLSLGFWLHDDPETRNKTKVRSAFDLRMLFGMALFFLYVGAELSIGLWSNSYLIEKMGLAASVSGYLVALYYASIMVGRFLSGFVAVRLGNRGLIRLGLMIVSGGLIMMFVAEDVMFLRLGMILMGLGLAPLYPAMMHETPRRFKEDLATRLIGYQVGIAYGGGMIITAGLGFLFNVFDLSIFYPLVLVVIVLMIILSELYNIKTPSIGKGH
jgi:fucose permease